MGWGRSLEGDLRYRGARDWEGSGSEKGQLDRGLGWGRSLGVQEPGKGTEVWVCEGTLAWDGAEVWKDAGAWEFIIVWEGPGVGKGLNAGA